MRHAAIPSLPVAACRAPSERGARLRLSLLLALAAAPIPLLAQSAGAVGDGFAFQRPILSLTVRGGYDRPSAGSEIYDFSTTNLTLSKGDFAAAGFLVDIGVRVSDRTEIVFSGGHSRRNAPSEFRDFIDNNDQPIEQTTRLRRTPIAAGVKFALTSPGEKIGKFAWIPARFTPWAGVGGGSMWYSFSQVGDFVDFQSLDVFPDQLTSDGWTPMGYAQLGADIRLTTRVSLTGDIRYTAARARMSNSFQGFDRIDLSGTAATMGFTLRL
ncbi:MAG: hypothetical protein U5K74_16205 [Gemmatimonadaceae bacterium]|nr:hypothetical protein [Gemmatimonadaceae bacterium]